MCDIGKEQKAIRIEPVPKREKEPEKEPTRKETKETTGANS